MEHLSRAVRLGLSAFVVLLTIDLAPAASIPFVLPAAVSAQVPLMPLRLAWSSTETDHAGDVSVAWGDLDGDGDLDLAIGKECLPTVADNCRSARVYRSNNGLLNSRPAWEATDSAPARSLAWGDADGDGDLDLAVANAGKPNRLYRNNSGQLSSSAVWESSESSMAERLAWGDLDGDGDLDLAVANADAPLRIYRNTNGQLARSASMQISAAAAARDLAWGDADGDGDLDLAVARAGAAQIYRNNNGTLGSPAIWLSDASDNAAGLAWGDLDGDGDLDLAVGNLCAGRSGCRSARVYRNNAGVLSTTPAWSAPGPGEALRVAWGDADGDGGLDLVVVQVGEPTKLYRNEGGMLGTTAVWNTSQSELTRSVAWGDTDGDGDLDLAVGNGSGQPTRLYRNEGVVLGTRAAGTAAEDSPKEAAAWGDLDGDGDLDLALGYLCAGRSDCRSARVYRNEDGILTRNLAWESSEAGDSRSLAWGDVDGDGDLDLALGLSCSTSNPAGCRSVRLYRNSGGLLSSTPFWLSNEAGDTYSLAWGDADGDGDLDLAVANYDQPSRLYRNDGGMLSSSAAWSAEEVDRSWDIAWGDADGDGDLDLAVANDQQPNRLYRNYGGLLGARPAWSSVETDPTRSLAWGDVDGDGDLDLAAGSRGGFDRLYRNEGGLLTSSAAWSAAEAGATTSLAWADFDGDGDLDLAAGDNQKLARMYPNNIHSGMRLPNGSVGVTAASAAVASLSGASATSLLDQPVIPISYTLSDPEGDAVARIAAEYSLDGGGHWQPAVAVSATTRLTSLTTRIPEAYDLAIPTPIAIPDEGIITPTLMVPGNQAISDIDVFLRIDHPRTADLNIHLISPQGKVVALAMAATGTGGFGDTVFDDEAGTTLDTSLPPYRGRFRPAGQLGLLKGQSARGIWRLSVQDRTGSQTGALTAWGLRINTTEKGQHVFNWDTFASGVYGQLDKAVVRLIAYPSLKPTRNGLFGSIQQPLASAQTLPFRLRGTQVRVLQEGVALSGASVYRLPASHNGGALPLANNAGEPFRSTSTGYLAGRGALALGDGLVALAPITATESYTVYATSAPTTPTGLALRAVAAPGVQTLSVTPSNTLTLFSLDVALEWDASGDQAFLTQLDADLRRASELLFDWTNGQAALGELRLIHDARRQVKQPATASEPAITWWDDAHIRIYATNRLRPNANQGGIVDATLSETLTVAGEQRVIEYQRGQVRMGAVWNRYGEDGSIGDDWPRTLAHELGHYLLFLDDNYLGLDTQGRLIGVSGCDGPMSDPYVATISTFRPAADWLPACEHTLSNRTSGRADWTTMQAFYPWMRAPTSDYAATPPGPSGLPLAVTRVRMQTAAQPVVPLDDPTFALIQNGGQAQPGAGARAILFRRQAGQPFDVIDLGQPVADRVTAPGARAGDRLCVYDLSAPTPQLGCRVLAATDADLTLHSQAGWRPDLIITPVNSTTVDVAVRAGSVPANLTLHAQLYPADGQAGPIITLTRRSDGDYSGRFRLTTPVQDGIVHLYEAGAESANRREVVADYALGGYPGKMRARRAPRGEPGKMRARRAPALSPDGQLILFSERLSFAADEFLSVQVSTGLPPLPAGRTRVGRGYWLQASRTDLDWSQASVNISFLPREVLPELERGIRVYRWNGTTWQPLPTAVDEDRNEATTRLVGPGLYVLLTAAEVGLHGPGWNLASYPLRGNPSVPTALRSIEGFYRTVYGYDSSDRTRPWRLYDPTVPDWAHSLLALSYGQAFWISATTTVSLYLAPGASNPPLLAAGGLPAPPATYYGNAPVGLPAGQTIEALIGDQVCGSSLTRQVDSQIVYVVHVVSDEEIAGCGRTGARVWFRGAAGPLGTGALWSRAAPQHLPLDAAAPESHRYYFAFITGGG